MPDALRKRVLFFAEAVTLAHVARPAVLSRVLDPARYDVHLACAADRYEFVLQPLPVTRWNIESVTSASFLQALARGARLYERSTLARYVEDDLRVLEAVRPDIVIGDFRLSLAISAPRAGVPYVALTNAYWSPYARRAFPIPEHPLLNLLGLRLAKRAFQCLRPAIFAYHARPLNQLRRAHGLSALGDLCSIYTWGDYTLYADLPELVPIADLPSNHHFLGPVLWEPQVAPPAWWNLLAERPSIYITLGSSGETSVLPAVLAALAPLPVTVMVATAGRVPNTAWPDNARAADYLPGRQAASRSGVVICNGGSPTVYQALAVGVPVLGIPTNMDQYLNMQYVEHYGAGLMLRAEQATSGAVRTAVERLFSEASFHLNAARCRTACANYRAEDRFRNLLADWLI